MADLNQAAETLLEGLVESLGLDPQKQEKLALVRLSPAPDDSATNLAFRDQDITVTDEDRFLNSLAVFLVNVELEGLISIRLVMQKIDELIGDLDGTIQGLLQRVLHGPTLRMLETNWRSLAELVAQVESEEVVIDFLDVTKEELRVDLEDHANYILNSALFRKVYVDEYDRYGGKPIGCMVSLDYFDCSDEDIEWLRTMSRISQAAHCPFIGAVGPDFFDAETWEELERESDLEALMSLPKYGRWSAFREEDSAAYVGLTLPRYLLRRPWEDRSARGSILHFEETIRNRDHYLWGSAAVLFARNMVRSFEHSGWCQHITGPRGGGLLKGLPVHTVMHHGHPELQPPVEIAIPDYRELQFAKAGFIPLIHHKDSADACFFSSQSIKKPLVFEDDLDTKNADLVTNLAYTMSVTRLAHHVKRMVRDYIGSTADGPYIQAMLEDWLIEYVTTAVNPDDLTLLYYPFKAMSVLVEPKPGPFGWYKCAVSVLPHAHFQGMDVELRLEAALGGP